MNRKFLAVSLATTAAVAATSIGMPSASADDPLLPIKRAVNTVRASSGCAPLNYSLALQAVSQQSVRSFMTDNDRDAAGFVSTRAKAAGYPFGVRDDLGQGDKSGAQNQVIASMTFYIKQCVFTDFGVGFLRNERANNNYAAITLGAAPRSGPKQVPRTPATTATIAPPKPATTAVTPPNPYPYLTPKLVTGDVDVYDVPGGTGRVIGMLRGGGKVYVVTRRDDNWVQVRSAKGQPEVPGGTAWVWGDFIAK